jgi:hypothetical protein
LKRKKFRIFCLYIKAKILPNNEYFLKYGDVGFEISYRYKVKSPKNESNEKSHRTNSYEISYISKYQIQEEFK